MVADLENGSVTGFLNAQKRRVVSIYRQPKEDPPTYVEHLGSGTLMQLAGRYFLATAAHVLDSTDAYDLGCYAMKEGRLASHVLRGLKHVTPIPEGGRDADKIDVGVMILDGGDVDFFGPENFYSPTDCELRHRCRITCLYSALGYPNTKNEPDIRSSKLEKRPFSMSGHGARQEYFKKFGVAEDSHVLIEYDGRKTRTAGGPIQTAPRLTGISGGPTFRFRDYLKEGDQSPKIVGLNIETHKSGSDRLVLSTNIGYVLTAMQRVVEEIQQGPDPGRGQAA